MLKIKKAFAFVMALAFCLCALPTVITAEESAYALAGTINSVLEIMDGSTEWGVGDNDGLINIQLQTGGTGAIFTAYKLLNITNVGGILQVSIPTGDDGKAQAFWDNYVKSVDSSITEPATIKDIKNAINSFGTDDSRKSSSIVDAFVKFANKPDGIRSEEAIGDKTKITTTFGFYAILQTGAPVNGHIASAPVLACLPMQETDSNGNKTGKWLKSYTVKPKDDTISIDKRVKATGDGDTYKDETITNIGDTVSYEIIAELPTYGADIVNSTNGITYTIEDTPDPVKNANTNALTLKSDTIKVYYTQNADKSTNTYDEVPTGAYNKIITLENNKFTITLDKDYYANNINGNYTYLKITYDATLNENALIEGAKSTVGDTTYGPGNNNTAKLTYSNTSTSTAYTSADAKVYTLELDITKIDNDDPSIKLDGAVFQVYRTDTEAANPTNAIKFIDISGNPGYESGKHYRVATDAEITVGTNITTNIEVATSPKGEMNIYGLNDQDYHFKEIVAPVGYNLPSDSELFTITVQPKGDDYGLGGSLSFNTDRQTHDITNDSGIKLPVTGGMGTILFTAIGLLLMAGAAYFLFAKKKESR